VAVRRNVAWWFAGHQPVEALVVDDTGFAKDGAARVWPGSTRHAGQGRQLQIGVSAQNERASCAANWRPFARKPTTPSSMIPAAAAGGGVSGLKIPDEVRHTEKWWLALR
jgi:hypothetical protein